jgi:hypothetical protein
MTDTKIVDLLAARRARSKEPEVWCVMPDYGTHGDHTVINALIVHIDDPRYDKAIAHGKRCGRMMLTASEENLAYITAMLMVLAADKYDVAIDDTILSFAGPLPDWKYDDILAHLKGVNASFEALNILEGWPDQDEEENAQVNSA